MGIISPQNSLPDWARASAERARQAQVKLDNGESHGDAGLHIRVPSDERVTREIGDIRDDFVYYKLRDEDPEFDKALGQVGVVELEGSKAEYSGTSLNGKIEIKSGRRVLQGEFQDNSVSYRTFQRNGNFRAGNLKLDAPAQSYQISSQSFHTPIAEVPESKFAGATASAAETLKSIPDDSDAALFKELFLDNTASMTEVRETFRSELLSGVSEANLPEDDLAYLKGLCEEPTANTPRALHDKLQKLSKSHPELSELKEKAAFWQSLEDFPKLKSDGVMRAAQHYLSPQALMNVAATRGWDFDEASGLPIADSVVVGGGPGGLSSAYHLSERGTRTVLLEGGHIGQGFSDANAQSVHQLRTNGAASNLIYTANANQLGVDVSMHRQLPHLRSDCNKARQDWSEGCSEKAHGTSDAYARETFFPAHRNELFAHMSQVAQGLSVRYPDTLVSENSPVKNIEKLDNGLFKITTHRGHEMLARSLVMATGFVGGDGEHARNLEIFQKLEDTQGSGVTVLANDHDLFRDNNSIDNDILVFSERMIGRPEIRQELKELPEGSRLTVIGGGESATKGALEALCLNPGLSVDLYTSDPLEPYQTQIPTSVLAPGISEAAIREKEVAQRTISELRGFGTPVTPDTLEELLNFEAEGRLRVRELGKRFDSDTMNVVPKDGKLEIELKDQDVAQNLRQQRQTWVDSGLYGDKPPTEAATELPQADMVMVAAGYDINSVKAGPLLQQLEAQGLIEFERGNVVYAENGLTSSKEPMLSFNTAGAVAMASDTAIPGRAIRAYRLARHYDEVLPQREKPAERIESGLPFSGIRTDNPDEVFNWTKEEALKFIDDGGVHKAYIEERRERFQQLEDLEERESALLRLRAEERFPGPNSPLATLMVRAEEVPESLTPAEKLMWEKANSVNGNWRAPRT